MYEIYFVPKKKTPIEMSKQRVRTLIHANVNSIFERVCVCVAFSLTFRISYDKETREIFLSSKYKITLNLGETNGNHKCCPH